MRKKRIQLEELLETALRVFARYGYSKTTLDDISVELDMTKANLYNYVESKDELYHQAIAHSLRKWRVAVEKKVMRFQGPVDQFRVMIREAMIYIEQDPILQQILCRDNRIFSISRDTDQFDEVNKIAREMLKELLLEGIRRDMFYDVDPDLVTEYLFSTYMMFLMKQYVIHEGERTSRVFEESLRIIVRGLVKPEYL